MRRENGEPIFTLEEFHSLLDDAIERGWFRKTEVGDDFTGTETDETGYFWTTFRLDHDGCSLEFTVQNVARIEKDHVHVCLFDDAGDELNGNFVSTVNGPGGGWCIQWSGFDVEGEDEDGDSYLLDEEELAMEVREHFDDASDWPDWLKELDMELKTTDE